jgi:hypothetical protein
MQQTQVRYWMHGGENQVVTDHNSSVITIPFLRKFVGRADDDPEEEGVTDHMASSAKVEGGEAAAAGEEEEEFKFSQVLKMKREGLECTLSESGKKKEEKELVMGGEIKRIEIMMVEFDWIFSGKEGNLFIEELALIENDDLFKVETIQICVNFLWEFYYRRILFFVFIPYIVFFVIFLTYSAGNHDPDLSLRHKVFGIICLSYSVYTIIMEVRQMFIQGIEYFTSSSLIWNVIDFLSSAFVCASIIEDLTDKGDSYDIMAINSCAVFLLWLKLFYFLRIFHSTAAFIRMITEILKDMGVFSFIYLMANLAFANAFFILDGGTSGVIADDDKITGTVWWETFLYTYMTGLGEFNPDDFPNSKNQAMLWVFFVLCSILIQVVLLNLLIAIMGDTFDRVQEIKEEAALKEKCKLISENYFWLNQERVFKRTKYIAVAKLEQAEGSNSGSWEGKLAALK